MSKTKVPVNVITCQRIKQERTRHNQSQTALGIALGFKSKNGNENQGVTVRRYEKGEYGVPDHVLEKMAILWSTTVDYLKGYTDQRDPSAYALECASAESDAADEYFAEKQAERVKMEILFAQCGFKYEDLSASGALDFACIVNPTYVYRPHQITDENDPALSATFSDEELEAIKSSLSDLIGGAILRVQRRQ